MIDIKDKEIMNILQSNARSTNPAIGKAVGLVPSAVFERIRKLEARGVIRAYETRLDPKAVGLGLLAFVFLKVEIGLGGSDIDSALADISEVQEIYHLSGEDCYMMKVWAADTDDLGALLLEKIHTIEGVKSTRTAIVLKTVKETSRLPLERLEKGTTPP